MALLGTLYIDLSFRITVLQAKRRLAAICAQEGLGIHWIFPRTCCPSVCQYFRNIVPSSLYAQRGLLGDEKRPRKTKPRANYLIRAPHARNSQDSFDLGYR